MTIVIAAINVFKPYKPRKLKNDSYHRLMREARKKRPKNGMLEAQRKRVRDKWVKRNKPALLKRAQFVRKQKKLKA